MMMLMLVMLEKKQGCLLSFEAPFLFFNIVFISIFKVFKLWSMEGGGLAHVIGREGGKPVEEEFVGVADLSCDLAMHVLCYAAMLLCCHMLCYAMLCYALLCLSCKECMCYILGLDCTP